MPAATRRGSPLSYSTSYAASSWPPWLPVWPGRASRRPLAGAHTPRAPLAAQSAQASSGRVGLLLGPARTVRALEVLGTAMVAMRDALDARITLEVAIVRLTHPEADDDPAALLERIERLERRIHDASSGRRRAAGDRASARAARPCCRAARPCCRAARPAQAVVAHSALRPPCLPGDIASQPAGLWT